MKIIILLALFSLNIALAQTTDESRNLIRYVNGDFITFMRSNPAWSWSWFKDHSRYQPETIAELARHQGVVGADVKPDNVDLTLTSSSSAEMMLVDLDDSGRGSFLGDIFHTLAYNEIWPNRIDFKEAVSLYVSGLKMQLPSAIGESYSLIDFKALDREKEKLEKQKIRMAESEEFFIQKLALIPPHSIPSDLKSSFEFSAQTVSRYGAVIRSGLRLKENGGSMGAERFTFLINSKHGLEIFEVKHQTTAAVSAFTTQQLSHDQRISEVLKFYRPSASQGSFREVVKTPRGHSIVRTKEVELFDSSNLNVDIKIYQDYIRTMFFWLGQTHGKQNSSYVKLFTANENETIKVLKKLVEEHLQESLKHHAKTNSKTLRLPLPEESEFRTHCQ